MIFRYWNHWISAEGIYLIFWKPWKKDPSAVPLNGFLYHLKLKVTFPCILSGRAAECTCPTLAFTPITWICCWLIDSQRILTLIIREKKQMRSFMYLVYKASGIVLYNQRKIGKKASRQYFRNKIHQSEWIKSLLCIVIKWFHILSCMGKNKYFNYQRMGRN